MDRSSRRARKREVPPGGPFSWRNPMADSHTQFSSSQQPCLFRRYGYYSSKNLSEAPINRRKSLCTDFLNSALYIGRDTFSGVSPVLSPAPALLRLKSLIVIFGNSEFLPSIAPATHSRWSFSTSRGLAWYNPNTQKTYLNYESETLYD